ncbi:ribonucleoside-diphosphate reductase, adenosylcobalamin-dependent [bacterium E08(2017)]|nr:ribonucleoside-diphosphate reductase, adenosylcobalamin-dependent [bacterium E08(2017)]
MLDARESVERKEKQRATTRSRGTKPKGTKRASGSAGSKPKGLKVKNYFVKKGENPYAGIKWEKRRSSITDDKGGVVFEQNDVEVPKTWSVLATNIVASKYFYGAVGTDERENSARQLVHRVARTIADWGLSDGYFASQAEADNYCNELSYTCIHQYGAFNSPVWFNAGLYHMYGHTAESSSSYAWNAEEGEIQRVDDTYQRPQCAACFIQSVDDTMEDIMRLAKSEAMLFKHGSGTGTDLSTLRSSKEKLSGGGTPSGPLSFMRVFDQVAAVIKSGGKTRRAAKMQSLKVHHPDIVDFINCKIKEEKKAWSLIEEGYDGSFGGEAYESVMFQNANLSVRVTDEFMRAVENDGTYETKAVVSGKTVETLKARDIFRQIAEGTHLCGDPGLQYDTTINRWHTCMNSGRINASNPCSEYMFLDNSACNLASINLMKFVDADGDFDVEKFKHVVRLFIIAQDIIVDSASYPSKEIAENSHLYRPLGLGYANLGALLMQLGLPYDSSEGRAFAGIVTALMTGQAYTVSNELAKVKGSFDLYQQNREPMANVLTQHRRMLDGIKKDLCPSTMVEETESLWRTVVETAPRTGFRNAQVTLLAPTGTIGFMMDCDTTGVEPDIALVKYKQLAGGGMIKIVNQSIRKALAKLGYKKDQIEKIVEYIDKHDTIEGAAELKKEHLQIFDCAFKPQNGERYISYTAHLKMMAAVQPFLSGAISKTVNLPNDATIDEIMQAYIDGWKMGLKAVAMYRDGSKRTQPLNTNMSSEEQSSKDDEPVIGFPFRRRMPATRQSITHKFEVAGHEGYLTVGIYEDGGPGELFITMAKEGSTVGGIMDAFGTAISLCLQYGVGLQELCKKFAHSRFEPAGFTKNPDIPIAKSIVDYIFRWLNLTFPDGRSRMMLTDVNSSMRETEEPEQLPEASVEAPAPVVATAEAVAADSQRVDDQFKDFMQDAPICDSCGAITVRNGSCYRCFNCGNSMGCS